jgi:hypothetical protein
LRRIVLERQLPDLRVQRLHVHSRGRLDLCVKAKDARGTFQKLGAPLRDLAAMHIELLSEFDQRLLALDDRQCHLALKAGLWFRRSRLAIVISSLSASCRCRADNPRNAPAQVS